MDTIVMNSAEMEKKFKEKKEIKCMNINYVFVVAAVLFSGVIIGCQPKTPAEKVINKVEDATHETGQAIERAGEKVKDAAR